MSHDFRPDPEVSVAEAEPETWTPELWAIVGIFAVLWIALALHIVVRGTLW